MTIRLFQLFAAAPIGAATAATRRYEHHKSVFGWAGNVNKVSIVSVIAVMMGINRMSVIIGP